MRAVANSIAMPQLRRGTATMARLMLILMLASSCMFGATITFTDMVDNVGVGNEPGIAAKLTGAAALGLTLVTTGAEFNVGCGTGNSCLGANVVAGGNDFSGDLFGVFDTPTTVLNIGVVNASRTSLYDVNSVLLATYQGSFNYSGAGVKSFLFESSTDALYFVTFDDMGTGVVPEPATWVMTGLAFAALGLIRLRAQRA